jgi:hypothetical protein
MVMFVRWWDPDAFESAIERVRILKLHGSLNWFQFENRDAVWTSRIGISDKYPWSVLNAKGELELPENGQPQFLIGTFNKMIEYTSPVYLTHYYQFARSLESLSTLIVCGYGFGDKGINGPIVDWMNGSSERRMLVIHPRPVSLARYARRAIGKYWEMWKDYRQVVEIPKGAKTVTWADLRAHIR